MVIPLEIVEIASNDRWTAYTESARWPIEAVCRVFGEVPDSTWKFYDFREIVSTTEDWRREQDPSWFGSEPNDIDAMHSILIGELGYDRPFALDYRDTAPSVRFMTLTGDWIKIAESVPALLASLGIDDEDLP